MGKRFKQSEELAVVATRPVSVSALILCKPAYYAGEISGSAFLPLPKACRTAGAPSEL